MMHGRRSESRPQLGAQVPGRRVGVAGPFSDKSSSQLEAEFGASDLIHESGLWNYNGAYDISYCLEASY